MTTINCTNVWLKNLNSSELLLYTWQMADLLSRWQYRGGRSVKTVKTIISPMVSLRTGQFKPDSYMTEKLPPTLKARILTYLQSVPDIMIGDCPLEDPVTGKIYERSNIIREKDGYTWSSHTIYMLRKYDVKLKEEFLRLFDQDER